MDIPKSWRCLDERVSKPDGGWLQLRAWGWSPESEAAALDLAKTRLRNLVSRVRNQEPMPTTRAKVRVVERPPISGFVSTSNAPGRFATCSYLETIGSRSVHPDNIALLRVHDVATRVEERLPLA